MKWTEAEIGIAPKNPNRYTFSIRLQDDSRVEWRNLTLAKAQSMYRWTNERLPDNVVGYGWEEQA